MSGFQSESFIWLEKTCVIFLKNVFILLLIEIVKEKDLPTEMSLQSIHTLQQAPTEIVAMRMTSK